MPGMRSEIAGVGGGGRRGFGGASPGMFGAKSLFSGDEGGGACAKLAPIAVIAVIARDRRNRKGKDLPRIYADRRGSRKIAGIGPSGDRFIGSSACRTMRDRRERESRMTGHRTGCTKIRIPLAVSTGVRRDHKKRRTISFASRTPRDLPRAAMISDFLLS